MVIYIDEIKPRPQITVKIETGWVVVTVNRKKHVWDYSWEYDKLDLNQKNKWLERIGLIYKADRRYVMDNIRTVIDADDLKYEKERKRELKKDDKSSKYFRIREAITAFNDYLDMANKFISIQPLFYTPQKIWWLWNFERKCWEMVDEIDLLNELSKVVNGVKLFETKTKTEILNALKMRGRLNTPKTAKKTWIQFKDVIYDLETDETFEATPKFFVTNPIPYALGQSEETPEIDKLFKAWVAEKDVETLYEILAYCLLADYPLHRVFCLNGVGRNGKSSYIEIINKFVGSYNTTSTDLDTLVNSRFESAKLYKKLLCMIGEINSTIFKRTSLFKKLMGADKIGYEFKGKDGFDGYNYAKLVIATNKLPETQDKTIGYYSKWLIVDFENMFTDTPGLLDRIPEYEYNNLARKSIKKLKKILKEGFQNEGDYEDRMKRYEERACPLNEFLKKDCRLGTDYETPFWEIYEEYLSYLDERGFRKMSKKGLGNLLTIRGFEKSRKHFTKTDGSDGTMMVYFGIGLKSNREKDDYEAQQREELGGLKNS